ncbi:MAG: CARDB domain-containing protein, partial [Planctomycetota bacterium]
MSQAHFVWSDTGTIVASGTPAEPIIFTADTDDSVGGDSNGDGDASVPFRGYWESIYLDGPDNVFENVEVRYAGDTDGNGIGGGDVGSIELRRDESEGQPLLTNVRISDGYSNAVNVRNGAPTLQNVHAEDNRGVPYFFALASNAVTSGLTGRNSDGGDRVVVEAGTLTSDRTWNFPDLPVHPTSRDVVVRADAEGNPATLTIAPGTVVKMPQTHFLWADTGTIVADGTPEMPIVFTAATDDTVGGDSNGDGDATIPFRGYWESIYLDGPDNVLDNVEVRYAGDTDGNGVGGGQVGGVQLRREETENATQVTNLRVIDGYGNGVDFLEGTPTVIGVHAEGNAGVPYHIELDSNPITSGLTADDNDGGDQVSHRAGAITSDRTLDFPGLPIHFTSATVVVRVDGEGNPATLTIAPGNVIKVATGHFLWADTGNIQATGTPESPIVITAAADDTAGGDSNGDGNATVPFAGSWESIYLDGPNNALSNVEVRYAGDTDGNGVGGGQVAAIDIESDLTLANVSVTSSWAGAVAVFSGASVTYNGGLLDRVVESTTSNSAIFVSDGSFTGTDLDILDDDDSGDTSIRVNNGASATVSNSSFLGSAIAVEHLGSDPGNANFQNNWWGSAAGPHDPSAADGVLNDNPAGELVSDFVDYGSFLTLPPSRALGPRVVSLQRFGATTDPGPHHRYEADGTAFDVDGSRNGALIDGANYAEGRVGGSSFLLDGDGDFVDLGGWAPANEWTVAAWVNPNTVPATGRVGLVGGDSAGRDWSIGIRDGVYVANYKNGTFLSSGVNATPGVWNHVAATLRGSDLFLYIDGVEQATVNIGAAYTPTTSGTRIGSTTFNNAGFFDGRIDEVSVVERSVSDPEIVSLRDTGTIDPFVSKDRLLVRFDRPIDLASLGVADVSISGPSSVGVEEVQSIGDRTALITLSSVLENAGTYNLSIGPNVLGTGGLAMDQDADGVAGETPEDVFTQSFDVDRFGPRITSQDPSGTTEQVLEMITVTFNEAIDPESFTHESVTVLNPAMIAELEAFDPLASVGGFNVKAYSTRSTFTDLEQALTRLNDPSQHDEFTEQVVETIDYGSSGGNFPANRPIPLVSSQDYFVLDATATITIPSAGQWTFAVASDDGYRLEIDSFAAQFAGTRGLTTDLHTFDFPAAGDYSLRFVMYDASSGNGFELSAAQGERTEFNSDFVLVGDSAGGGLSVSTQALPPQVGIGVFAVIPIDDQNLEFQIAFPAQPLDGEYELRIDPSLTDRQGNSLDQDNDGNGGEPSEDRYVSRVTVARDPLRVVAQTPSMTLNGAFEEFIVTFNVPIDPGSFATSDASVIGPGGAVTVTDVEQIDATTYRVKIERQTEDGVYQLFVGPDITDPAGIAMDTDGDAIPGELEDRYEGSIEVAGGGPFVTQFAPVGLQGPGISNAEVTFSEPVRLSSFTPSDIVLAGPEGSLAITDIVPTGDRSYSLSFAAIDVGGEYSFTIGPGIEDFAGLEMDQDRDGTSGEAPDDTFTATFSIDSSGPRITAYTPDFVTRPYTFIDFTFDDAIDPGTFTPQDITLDGPDGSIAVSQVIAMDTHTVRVSFPSQETVGQYTFAVGPDIADPSGNRMDQDGDGVFGEATEDQFVGAITFSAPDLSVSATTIPDSAKNGETITIDWTVLNDGAAAAASPWTDRIVISTDQIFGNADDIQLDSINRQQDLAVDGTYDQSVDITIPFEIVGDQFILLRTDSSRDVFEEDEANNTIVHPFSIEEADPPADLIVDAISIPSTAFRGETIDVTWRVRNDGTSRTSVDTWTDRLYLSLDETLGGGDISLGDFVHNGALDSNASYTMTESPVIPASADFTNYFVLVQTDRTNQVDEPTAEDNNVSASAVQVEVRETPLPDLVVSDISLPAGATPTSGELLTLDWMIFNDGDADATAPWTDDVYLSVDNTLSADDVLLGSQTISSDLAFGNQTSASLAVALPDGISGTYHLIVEPDAENLVNEGAGEATGAGSLEIDIALFPYADLTVTEVVAPELLVGDPVDLTVSWTVQNVGDGPGRESNWSDRVILSTDDILGDGDDIVLVEYSHSGAVPAGQSYSRTEIIPLEARTSGRFTLFVQTDVNDVVFELPGDASNVGQPTNNVDITPTPYSDLFVESVSVNNDPLPTNGAPLEVTWSVGNRGIATTNRDTWIDYIYVSDRDDGSGLRLLGRSTHGGALAVDGAYTRTESFTLPRDLDGDYFIYVRTGGPYEFLYNGFDAFGGNQGRSDEFNVTFIPPSANLVVEDGSIVLPDAPEGFEDSTQIEIGWTVTNDAADGNGITESGWTDRVYIQSTDGQQTFELGRFGVTDPLGPGLSVDRTELVRLPRATGLFNLYVETDFFDQVLETDEQDNLRFSEPFQLNFQPRADLQVTVDSEYPAPVTAGTTIDVQFTVRNAGNADTPSGGSRWTDRVWLSNSSSSTSGAILLGQLQNGSALAHLGSESGNATEYTSSATFLIPRALSGNWFVLVETDARNNVDEFPFDANNRSASAISIDANPVPPPDLVVDFINGPGDTFDDSSITVRYKVTNRGAGPTDPSSWTDQIWLTLGLDGPNSARGDRFIGTFRHNGVLEVGESYEAETTVNIPQGLTGQYFLTVYADGYRSVYEVAFAENTNPDAPNDLDGNNYGSTPLNVLLTPPADLRVRDLVVNTADDPIVGETSVSLTWTVDNIGTVATDRENWADAIYVSEDDVFDGQDQLVFALPHVGRLQPGQEYSQEAEFTLPPTARGNHFLVRTNVDPRIALTDEERFLQEVAAVLKRIEEATGEPIGETEIGDLNQFSSSELRAILAGPTNTLVEVYEGPFDDNNVGFVPASVVDAVADLTVESVTASPTSRSGEPVNVSWTVRNVGGFMTPEVTETLRQYIYLSQDAVFDASRATLVGSQRVRLDEPLQPNQTYTDSATVNSIPGTSGQWYAHVFTNVSVNRFGHPSLNAFSESSFPDWPSSFEDQAWEDGLKENNGGTSEIIDVEYAEANLVISNLSAVPSSPDSGSLLDVSFTVTNEGTRATRVDRWSDRVFLSTDTATDSYDIELGEVERDQVLEIGESYEVSLQVRVPNNIGGTFFVIAQTDAIFRGRDSRSSFPYPIAAGPARSVGVGDSVAEFNDEGDNQATVELDVNFVPAPDLVVENVDFISEATPPTNVIEVGNDLTFAYTFSNDGGAIPEDQAEFQDRVYLSRDRLLDPSSDQFVATINRVGLAAGESGSITRTARLPRGITGDYFIIVQTDIPRSLRPDGVVIETDEENNITVSATPILIVEPPPSDLQVFNVTAPSTGQVGDVLSVAWTVENRGDVAARARFADAVYISEDNVWDIGDRLLGRVESAGVRTVNPGETYSETLDFEVPALLPDAYRIIVRTDIFDDVVEGENNRNNETASADEVNVTIPLLRFDIPLEDQLAVGVSRLFQLDTSPGETVEVALDSVADVGSHELFASYERLPTPFDFDAAYEGYLAPDQTLVIPETLGGRLARRHVRERSTVRP